MLERGRVPSFHCLAAVHRGAGQAEGAIDNPVHGERHAGHPCFLVSGVNGSLRNRFLEFKAAKLAANGQPGKARRKAEALTDGLFGPLSKPGEGEPPAGRVAFEATMLLLLARPPRHAFAWVTLPAAWPRVKDRDRRFICGDAAPRRASSVLLAVNRLADGFIGTMVALPCWRDDRSEERQAWLSFLPGGPQGSGQRHRESHST